CWAPAPTFGPSRNCWATPACRPRSATPTSTPRDYSTPTPARIRGRRRFPSGLHRPPLDAHGSLTPGFGTGWVGVTGAGHILAGGAEGHGLAVFADHLGRLRADDVDAEDLVSLRVGEHLGEAFGLVVDLGPAVGAERELAGLVGPAGFLELLFGLADPGDFGSGVDHARHQGVVHVTRLAGDDLDAGDRVLFGLVGQHRPVDHVADRPDAGRRGAEVVGLDEAALVGLHAHALQSQALGERPPADGHQHVVGFQRLGFAAGHRFDGQRDAVLAGLGAGHLGPQLELHALLGQRPLEGLGGLAVHPWGDAVEELDDGDLGAQPAPHRSQLKADDPGAD